jgi:hypothetical protein
MKPVEIKEMLPEMLMVKQQMNIPSAIDSVKALEAAFLKYEAELPIKPGMRIAIGVGSRGIDCLPEAVAKLADFLKKKGAMPFVTPAMGSHGGAVAKGQIELLAHRGITQETIGVPVEATMDTVSLGDSDCGIPLFIDRLVHEADGYVLINRIKPHTNFIGPTESGILKMAAIGIGNQYGAEYYHRLSLVRPQYEIISTAGREVIKRSNFFFGVGLVENQKHQLCHLDIGFKGNMEELETMLLKTARSLVPLLPVRELDLLIIDEMGKEISGEGIDPNVVGRDVIGYGAKRPSPRITRIFVRDLTDKTYGSAVGISQADFTLKKAIDKIDMKATEVNCLTACAPEAAMLPLAYETDMQVLEVALKCIRPCQVRDIKMAYIKNTLELEHIFLSKVFKKELEKSQATEIVPGLSDLQFDSQGMLISPF